MRRMVLLWGALGILCFGSVARGEPADAAMAAALARVAGQSPDAYPAVVREVPDRERLAELADADLLEMLGYWNPAVRAAVAAEIGQRGEAFIEPLRERLGSDSADVRAGALLAFVRMITHRTNNWQAYEPDAADVEDARARIRGGFADVILDRVIALAGDESWSVRQAALAVMITLNIQNDQMSRVVLALSLDADAYIADQAMRTLGARFGLPQLEREALIEATRRMLQNPLPRGKGPILNVIVEADRDFQEALIPDLLAFLDHQPDRDTMFGQSGQAEALRLLTALRVPELVPRLPALMDKPMRGDGLFADCMAAIKAFGVDAKEILPQLQARITRKEAELAALGDRTDRHANGLRAAHGPRLAALRGAVNDVSE